MVGEIVTAGLKYSCRQKGFAQQKWVGCRWASCTEAEVPASPAKNELDLMLTTGCNDNGLELRSPPTICRLRREVTGWVYKTVVMVTTGL